MTAPLPIDIFGVILGHLDVHDVLNIRKVCHDFYELSKLRSVWAALLHKCVIKQNIPIPGLNGQSIDLLSALEMERSLYKALKLRRNWASASPTIVRQSMLEAIPGSRIVSMHVVPGHGNRLLLSLAMLHGPSRMFILRCWDIGATYPTCLAMRVLHHFRGMAVNKSSSGSGVVAVLNPHTEILSVESQNINAEFMTIATIPEEATSIQLFLGSSLLTGGADDGLHLWDVNNPHAEIKLQNPELLQNTRPLDTIITQRFIVVLRPNTLEFYVLPKTLALPSPDILHPAQTFNWPWRIDNAVMTIRHQSSKNHVRKPINIFIRFGSYFPWAINILHHYELCANVLFLEEIPMGKGNLPYDFPPLLRETIGSPVRLHATSDMAIGDYGTAIWTDSHTEDYFNHADRGQRVAGRFSHHAVDEEGDDGGELSDQVASAAATSVYAYQEEDTWVRVALDESEGRIFLGRDDGVISVLEYV